MDVPIPDWPMRNYYLSQKDVIEETQEFTLGSQDDDKYVSYISSKMLTGSQMHKENDDHIHEDVEDDHVIPNGGVDNNHDHAIVNEVTLCEVMLYVEEDEMLRNSIARLEAIRFTPRIPCILKSKLYFLNVKSASLYSYLNMEVEDPFCANILKRVMDKLTMYHVINIVNDNIDDVVNHYDNVGDGSISLNKGVHDMSDPVNESVNKKASLYKNTLKRKYLKWISTKSKPSKEALTFEKSV
ncbi:unnamed protein product [Vicia faba]|uniref:Uncharacterized protein n=1 Tax=Vicia faba TaxID=3906 RepID=A0AAV0YC94_VICFA|nr:unnamed protein product [Vicia faba]